MSDVIKQRILMDEAYLKEYSLLPKNFNVQEIWNFIPIAENLHIVPLIGEDKYNELLDQVENNDVTPENAKLLLLIYPFESLAICEVAMPYLAFHITEVGITKGKSENSESVSVEDINYLTNYIRSLMTPTKDRLIKYLKSIGLYEECECKVEKLSGRVYSTGQINTDVDGNKLYSNLNNIFDNNCWSI